MGSLTNDQRDALMGFFKMRDFRTMWDIIYNEYQTKHLGDGLDDETMIAEFQYITQQLRKYISNHQDQILDHGADFDGMLKELENMIESAGEYAKERRELVYNFLRDQWIIEVHDGILWLRDEDSIFSEEGE